MHNLSFGIMSKCFFRYLRHMLNVLIHLFSSGRDKSQTKAPASGRIYLVQVGCYDPVDRVYTVHNCSTRADMKAGRAVPWL